MSDGATRAEPEATQGPSGTPPAVKRVRAAMTAGLVLMLALLGVFAYLLVDAQRQARQDVEQRFRDVAQVSSALVSGLFEVSQAGSTQQAMSQLAGRRIDPARLEAVLARGNAVYLEVYGRGGRRLAATRRAPRDPAASAEVVRALRTGRARLSNAIGSGRRAVIEWAIPYRGVDGPRVFVSTIPIVTLGQFLAGFLRRVPNFADADSEVVDGHAVVLGGSDVGTRLGRPLADRPLGRALAEDTSGDYGGDRYFAASPIANSPWNVVIATDRDDLYSSISGSRQTVPWILFAAFAVAALGGLLLMRRAALTTAELQRRELSERHAVEINDNIIQGLALASYELQRGERMAGSTQVADTLREAQRLVSELLGEGEIEPGRLRRESAARTDREPAEDEG